MRPPPLPSGGGSRRPESAWGVISLQPSGSWRGGLSQVKAALQRGLLDVSERERATLSCRETCGEAAGMRLGGGQARRLGAKQKSHGAALAFPGRPSPSAWSQALEERGLGVQAGAAACREWLDTAVRKGRPTGKDKLTQWSVCLFTSCWQHRK